MQLTSRPLCEPPGKGSARPVTSQILMGRRKHFTICLSNKAEAFSRLKASWASGQGGHAVSI